MVERADARDQAAAPRPTIGPSGPPRAAPGGRTARRRGAPGAGRRRPSAVAVMLVAAGGAGGRSRLGVAPSVEVAGVDLGRPEPQATAALVSRARAIVARPIDVRDGTRRSRWSARRPGRPAAGRPHHREAREREPNILRARGAGLTGAGPEDQPLLVAYKPGALEQWVSRIAETIDRPAMPSRVVVKGTTLRVVAAQTGRRVDQEKLAAMLSGDLAALPSVLRLPIDEEQPAQSTDASDRAALIGRRDPVPPGDGAGGRPGRADPADRRGPGAALRGRPGRGQPLRPGAGAGPGLPPPRATGPLGPLRGRGPGGPPGRRPPGAGRSTRRPWPAASSRGRGRSWPGW